MRGDGGTDRHARDGLRERKVNGLREEDFARDTTDGERPL